MENSKKSNLTIFAEIAGIISLIVAIILGINQWKSNEVIDAENQYSSQFLATKPKENKVEAESSEKNGEVIETNLIEMEIKNFVKNYFDALMRRDLDAWSKMFDSNISRYYDLYQPTIKKMVENQRKFYNVYKFDRISIDWSSLKYKKINADDYLTTFNLNYKNKKNENDPFKNYDLSLTLLLSKDFKIKSIYEMRN